MTSDRGSVASLPKAMPLLVIPKPVLSVRNLLHAGSAAADSSREMLRFGMTTLLGASNCTTTRPLLEWTTAGANCYTYVDVR